MGAQQPPPDRPNTLGQAWRRMAEPPPRALRDLPTLPDWPPLPDEPSPSAWPSLDQDVPDESHPAAVPARGRPRRGGIFRPFGGASKRTRIGVAAAVAIVVIVLIVAGSRFVLRATNAMLGSATQTPSHGGTPHALQTATPHATNLPSPTTAPPPPLTLAFTCASGQIRGTGQVCVHTLPQASLTLAVRYCDGTTAKGLHGGVTADGSGNYTWSWPVHTTCAGPATATVKADWNGQSLTESDTFTITR